LITDVASADDYAVSPRVFGLIKRSIGTLEQTFGRFFGLILGDTDTHCYAG
jgi:hypothetical protein